MAVLIRYTAYVTVLAGDNLLVSADWPGALRARLRPAVDCPVMVANGSAVDCDPRRRGSMADAVEQLGPPDPMPEARRKPQRISQVRRVATLELRSVSHAHRKLRTSSRGMPVGRNRGSNRGIPAGNPGLGEFRRIGDRSAN